MTQNQALSLSLRKKVDLGKNLKGLGLRDLLHIK